jgi:hypothetical protein
MRFAHIADCHLGGWRQQELRELNLASFKKIIDICISEKVGFIILSGDLFDSAYPPIEILKEAFSEFKRLKEHDIKCFIIAGSHDYSVSGKTFLEVLEKAGFCEICKFRQDEQNKEITLKCHNHQGIAIYGYSGKKSGLEIEDLKNISLEENSRFRILMLHTTMESAKGNLPIDSVDINELPDANYYALGHLHLTHEYKVNDNKYLVYPGPSFPNNFQELEELKGGSFYIVDVNGYINLTKKEVKLKEVISLELEIENSITATDKIIKELNKQQIEDKIILLRLKGKLKQGKTSDIDFEKIKQLVKEKGAYVLLKNTSSLKTEEPEIQVETDDIDKIEENIISDFIDKNPSKFNEHIQNLINSLNLEKQEDEKNKIFESRLISEINKILGTNIIG